MADAPHLEMLRHMPSGGFRECHRAALERPGRRIWTGATIGPTADQPVVTLITVDPERDTPDVLVNYISHFSPRMLALIGNISEIAKAAETFRVRYEKIPQDVGDHTMNHTAGVFLFRRGRAFAGTIDFHEDARVAMGKIKRAMN